MTEINKADMKLLDSAWWFKWGEQMLRWGLGWLCVQTFLMGLFLWYIGYLWAFRGAMVGWQPPLPTPDEYSEMMQQNKNMKMKK